MAWWLAPTYHGLTSVNKIFIHNSSTPNTWQSSWLRNANTARTSKLILSPSFHKDACSYVKEELLIHQPCVMFVLNVTRLANYKTFNAGKERRRHHGMARPQVADRGTASDKEGSCE